MQSQASAVPFSFKMHAIPCKQWDEVAGQEAPVVLDVGRWPPFPRREAQLQLQLLPPPLALQEGAAGRASLPPQQISPPALGRRNQNLVTWRCSK